MRATPEDAWSAPLSCDGCIELKVWGRYEPLLVDTGAAVDAVGSKRIPLGVARMKLTRPLLLKGVGIERATEYVTCPIELEGTMINWDFIVIPESNLFVLGRPLLSELKATILCTTNEVILGATIERPNFCIIIDEEAGKKPCVETGKEPCVKVEDCTRIKGPSREGDSTQLPGLSATDCDTLDGMLKGSEFSEEGRARLRQILIAFLSVWSGSFTPKVSDVEPHRIELLIDTPVSCKLRPLSDELKRLIEKEIEKMLASGVIRPSTSPYACLPVLVRKKDGTLRFCMNYKALNKVTKLDRTPLPRIDELLVAIRDSLYFTSLDLLSGYWQIPMAEEDIEKTAFITHRGLFEWLVMPFGLTNAPATFQKCMNTLFGHLRFAGVLVYLDDVLCHGRTEVDSLDVLETVLQILQRARLKIKPQKCCFGRKRLEYLGFIVGGGELTPNPERVRALKEIAPPTGVPALRRILGLFGTYRKFIHRFADIVQPLSVLLRKGSTWSWGKEQQQALDTLKTSLCTLTLYVPLDTDQFILETDASGVAAAAVLSVVREEAILPVEFASTTFSETEAAWTTSEKECYAIVWAVKKFDGFLRGRYFKVFTDHACLRWLWKSQVPKLERWAQVLQEYTMDIFHKAGAKLAHVDALSRPDPIVERYADRMSFCPLVASVGDVANPTFPSLIAICHEQKAEALTGGPGWSKSENLWRYNSKLYIPKNMRSQILDIFHGTPLSGHPGTRRMCMKLRKLVDWPGLENDVRNHIRGCIVCARMKVGRERFQGASARSTMTAQPNDIVALDVWGPHHYGLDQLTCLTMIDYATRWAEVVIIDSTAAEAGAHKLLTSWITRFGVPRLIVTDGGPTFKAEFNELERLLGIKIALSAPYHPQDNAFLESFHRTLRTGLKALEFAPVPLKVKLSLVMWAYRSIPHTATGETPSFLLMGYDVSVPPEPRWAMPRYMSNNERIAAVQATRQFALDEWNSRRWSDQGKILSKTIFNVGDLILMRTRETGKFANKFSFPLRVTEVRRQGRLCTAKSMLDGKAYSVHITNAKFLDPPQTPLQEKLWQQEKLKEAYGRSARLARRRERSVSVTSAQNWGGGDDVGVHSLTSLQVSSMRSPYT